MHLSEGVLHTPILLAGALVGAIGIGLGLRQIKPEKLSQTALFSAVFFVASTIHVPVGMGSVHLILNGVAGLFLGWAVFPAFFIALLLQALLFSFGGFAVLGVNLCIMALPAVLVHYLFRAWCRKTLSPKQLVFMGLGAGVIGVGGAGALASFALALEGGKDYLGLIYLLLISHLPIFCVDSLISLLILRTLNKMKPDLLRSC